MQTKYVSTADTAKLVRQSLKEAFPGTKFSVQSDVYSGGASISIRWVDGPTTRQVDDVISVFQGGYFDSMTDYKGSVYAKDTEGNRISFGADFIFTNREYSDSVLQSAIETVWERYPDFMPGEAPTPEQYRKGDYENVWFHNADTRAYVHRELVDLSLTETLPSKTADSYTYAGDDGYRRCA